MVNMKVNILSNVRVPSGNAQLLERLLEIDGRSRADMSDSSDLEIVAADPIGSWTPFGADMRGMPPPPMESMPPAAATSMPPAATTTSTSPAPISSMPPPSVRSKAARKMLPPSPAEDVVISRPPTPVYEDITDDNSNGAASTQTDVITDDNSNDAASTTDVSIIDDVIELTKDDIVAEMSDLISSKKAEYKKLLKRKHSSLKKGRKEAFKRMSHYERKMAKYRKVLEQYDSDIAGVADTIHWCNNMRLH